MTRERPGEAALYTEMGGPEALHAHLGHLIRLAETAPNTEVRVLPYTAGAHPAVSCNFTVLAFPGAEDAAEPEVIYTENIVAFVLQDDSDEVARFQRIYDRVWGMTVDAEVSVAMMRQAQAKLVT